MHATAISANGPALRLCPPPAAPAPEGPAAAPPSHGRWVLHGMDCLMVRRRDGLLGCYIRIPHAHELHGRTNLEELSFALDCPHGITYSAAGAHGWFIGSVAHGCWENAWDLLDDLAEQLAHFTASDAADPGADRASAVHVRNTALMRAG
jgi:hypothetical protein